MSVKTNKQPHMPHHKKEDKEKFLQALHLNNGNITKACKKFKIDRKTYYRWLKDDWFADRVKDVRESLKDMLEDAFFRQVKEGNAACIIFGLKTQCRDRGYIDKSEQEVTHKGGQPIVINIPEVPEDMK